MSQKYLLLSIWIFSSLLAAVFAFEFTQATYLDGKWYPVGNDSFYHARRILDAINPEIGLYQFDPNIHMPEGSWLTWPWAYDWLMAQVVLIWQYFDPTKDSMMIITHMAVYWLFVNSGLLVLVGVVLNLRAGLIAIMMLGYAMLPLTQGLHGVGQIDHHYVEHTFILLTLLTGLAWLKRPEESWRACLLGISLGIAPAFHTGLFILQAPVLLTLFILWLRDSYPPKDGALTLAIALTLATLAALLPSEPFHQGQFEFPVLSWFHLYIAAISTLFIACMAKYRYTRKALAGLCLLGLALLIPIWQDTVSGASFLTQKLLLLDQISETKSPLQMIEIRGLVQTLGWYSCFLIGVPFLLVIYLWRVYKAQNSVQLFFAIMVVMGTVLLLTQYRLHYFGSFALILGWLVLLCEQQWFLRVRPWIANSALILLVLIAFRPSLDILFSKQVFGWDEMYKASLGPLQTLSERCKENPGLVLADNNFGHIVRYHTNCSVIANNFLMTSQHGAKIDEMWAYMEMSPEELLTEKPPEMKYVLSRMERILTYDEQGNATLTNTPMLERLNLRLPYELNSRTDLPARYVTHAEIKLDAERPNIMAIRVLEILPESGAHSEATSESP